MIRAVVTSLGIALCPLATQAEGLDEGTVADRFSNFERLLHRAGFTDLQKSYALVVGISEFDQFSDLPTERDPTRVRDYLINEAGFDYVHILTEEKVTKARLEELMIDEFRPLIGPSDRFLFYWSGHGETLEVGGGEMGFLPLAQSDKQAFSTMVAMSDLTRWNRFIQAHQVLYLLDSCFSGLAGGVPQSDLAEITREQLSGPGRHMITAGRANEQTIAVDDLGGSVFTHALLKGLRGAADTRNGLGADGLVAVGELQSYIGQEVGRLRNVYNWQKSITPQIRDLTGSDGAFFFPLPASFPPDNLDNATDSNAEVILQGGDPDITRIQNALIELGYDPGPADGQLGFATRLALIAFQTDEGLDRSGEADDATLTAILQALVSIPPTDATSTPIIRLQTAGRGPELAFIEGATFTMGRDGGPPEEGPATQVTVDPFYIATTETKMALFSEYLVEEGLDFVSQKTEPDPTCYAWTLDGRLQRSAYAYNQLQNTPDDQPVACVSLEDIEGFLAWLNVENRGAPYRLPTEAEFEYLLSGLADFNSEQCDVVNAADSSSMFEWRKESCDDGHAGVSPVGRFPADQFGLYDIRGNLWEWVSDCWSQTHNEASPTPPCDTGTVRGGSFDDPSKNLASTVRQPVASSRRQANIGFRVARDVNIADLDDRNEPQQLELVSVIDEIEPNDGIRDAQPLSVGQIVTGRFEDQTGDVDWYSVQFDSDNVADHEITLRHVNGNAVRATVYDRREQEIGNIRTRSGVEYFSLQGQHSSTIYIKASGAIGGWATDAYEISVERR